MAGEEKVEKSNILMYTTEDGVTKVEVTFDNDTVWLSLDQIADLFQRNKSTISRHIKNIFLEGELSRNSVVANFATTGSDGKRYHVDFYNLDVIISVGYRVKSQRSTQFRIWANKVLKEYMFKGYVINQRINKIEVTIYTNQIPKQLSLDLQRHNAQYDPIDIQLFRQSHDRFLIIDEKELYHIGTSLKDLGKKWFAFSKIQLDIKELLNHL